MPGGLPDPHAAAGRRDRRHLLLLGDHRAHLDRGLQPAGRRHPLAARQPAPIPAGLAGGLRGAGRRRVLARPRPARASSTCSRSARRPRCSSASTPSAAQAPVFAGAALLTGSGGGLHGADRLRGAGRAACAAGDARAGQPRAGPDGAAGRRRLPARRRHARPQHRSRRPSCRWASSPRSAARRSSSTCCARARRGPRLWPRWSSAGGGFAYPRPAARRAAAFAIRDLSLRRRGRRDLRGDRPQRLGQDDADPPAVASAGAAGGARSDSPAADSAPSRGPQVARQIAVVPQDVPHGFPFTVEELVLMGRYPHAPAPLLRERRGSGARPRGPWPPPACSTSRGSLLDRLSGGERQRVMLARALAQRAAAPRPRRADRAPRPALSGGVRRAPPPAERASGARASCSSRTIWTWRPSSATACSCSTAAVSPAWARRRPCWSRAVLEAGLPVSGDRGQASDRAADRSCVSPGRRQARRRGGR